MFPCLLSVGIATPAEETRQRCCTDVSATFDVITNMESARTLTAGIHQSLATRLMICSPKTGAGRGWGSRCVSRSQHALSQMTCIVTRIHSIIQWGDKLHSPSSLQRADKTRRPDALLMHQQSSRRTSKSPYMFTRRLPQSQVFCEGVAMWSRAEVTGPRG